ncbi:MAG TPA: hypothetical protein VK960_05770 [Acidimicrobiia bacterium]|nr:hypothetical protein [Acidimicrobiia bacterium]
MDLLAAVEVPLVGDARLKNWAKIVTHVDPTGSDGWAYDGDFIAAGGIQDVPIPSVLLVYGERGSRDSPRAEARVYLVNPDATLSLHATASGRAWARTLRDPVIELLERDRPFTPDRPWDEALIGYSEDALREELARRTKRDG